MWLLLFGAWTVSWLVGWASRFNLMRFGKCIYLKILKLSWQDVFFYRRRCDRCCASALLWTKTRAHVMNPPHYGGVHLVKVSSFLIFKLEDITHTGRKCVCALAGHQLWRPKNITPQQNCCHGSVCVWRLLQGGSCGWFHPKASQQDRTHFEMIRDVWSDCCSGWWSIIQSAEPFIISLINTQRHTRWICINPIHGCVVLVQHTQTAHRLLISSHINKVFTAAHTRHHPHLSHVIRAPIRSLSLFSLDLKHTPWPSRVLPCLHSRRGSAL